MFTPTADHDIPTPTIISKKYLEAGRPKYQMREVICATMLDMYVTFQVELVEFVIRVPFQNQRNLPHFLANLQATCI